MSRSQDRFQSIPLGTLTLVCANVALHSLYFITSFNTGLLSISAYQVIYEREYYRVVTAAFTHGGVLHILMNMMSLLQLGALLERSFGTLIFVILSMWSVVLCGFLYVLANWASSILISGAQGQLYSSAVGYSGVLFSYALISSYHTTAPSQSVFGFFNVPSKLYPWILLGIMQVILPNISLLGHLSGIMVGLLSVYGPVEFFLLPSKDFCREIDESNYCCGLTRRSNYCCTTDTALTTDSCVGGSGGAGQCFASFVSGFLYIIKLIWTAVAAFLHIIGCPSSVTSYSICTDCTRRANTFMSNMWPFQRRGGYDEVSNPSSTPLAGFSSTGTVSAVNLNRSNGGTSPCYAPVSLSDPSDLEFGIAESDGNPTQFGNGNKSLHKQGTKIDL